MGNFSLYRNTNVLRPRIPFGKLIARTDGCTMCSFTRQMYFGDLPSAGTFGGILNYWTGSSWVKGMLRTYNGSWLDKPMYVYKAGSWQLVDKN